MTGLPFEIAARLAERGQVVFTANVDGKPVTFERYAPGNGEQRRKVAARWCEDSRLWGGTKPSSDTVVSALEQAELEAMATDDALEKQYESSDETSQAASYADGGVIVELAWNTDVGGPDFIVYERATGNVSRTERVDTARGVIVPPSVCAGIVTPGTPVPGSVLVPTDCNPAGEDEKQLRREIEAFINRYVELPGDALYVVLDYVLLTWVYDSFDELPYVAFRTADAGRGKSRAIETVGAICDRPMFVGGGSSSAATLRLLDIFSGTLVADEFDLKRDTELASALTQILNQGFQANRPLVKCDGEANQPKPFRCYGPKLFALRRGFADDATETRTISIRMTQRTRADIPLSLPRAKFDGEALTLRNKLLGWRFANLGRIAVDPAHADSQLEDRLNQIGLPLLAVARSKDQRDRIVTALREQQAWVASDRGDTLAGEVFAVVVETVEPEAVVRPSEVAAEISRRRAAAERVELEKLPDRRRVTPHKVGKLLRKDLELPPLPKDAAGARYRLDPLRLQQLCQRFGHPVPETSPTSPTSSSPETSAEKPRLWPENGGSDVSDLSDVAAATGDVGGAADGPDAPGGDDSRMGWARR
ncbi:MAG: hypothetical protein V3W34_16105 [Phycisphaerae bacterium]